MNRRLLLGLLLSAASARVWAQARSPVLYKSAVVALTDDAQLRAAFERSLVEKARAHEYDAVASYEIVPNVADVNDRKFTSTLVANGVQAVLMLRPAAIGAGSSLESVRNEIPPAFYEDIRTFAGAISATGAQDLIAVVHMAIYILAPKKKPTLISSGAVWLDEPVTDRAEGIARLQDLIVENVNAARPAIRQHLGLPPLP